MGAYLDPIVASGPSQDLLFNTPALIDVRIEHANLFPVFLALSDEF